MPTTDDEPAEAKMIGICMGGPKGGETMESVYDVVQVRGTITVSLMRPSRDPVPTAQGISTLGQYVWGFGVWQWEPSSWQ